LPKVDYEQRRKRKAKDYDPKPCEWCSETFKPKRENQKFCDARCRYAAWFDRTYERRDKRKHRMSTDVNQTA
jgi:hypothetical protein